MKACLTALYLCAASWLFQAIAAEPTEADRSLLADIRVRAEKGYADAQEALGEAFALGHLGLEKDEAEAVKWFLKAASQNNIFAQHNLAVCFRIGKGVPKDEVEAVRWYRKASEQNYVSAQVGLAECYYGGFGVRQDYAEAMKWYRKAAEQNDPLAMTNLANSYAKGEGLERDEQKAVYWWLKASELGNIDAQYNIASAYYAGNGVAKDVNEAVARFRDAAERKHPKAQYNLGVCYASGDGIPKDFVLAYKWMLLSAAQGEQEAKKVLSPLESRLTRDQIAEGQKLAREFRPRRESPADDGSSRSGITQSRPGSSGTGFIITDDGYFITNQHVAGEGATVRLVTAAGLIAAKVVKVDKANDLALLKAEGKFTALPVITSRGVRLGATAATVGFPNTGLQGFAPKLARGEIASLAGAQDDARHFQISAPIQPGNSGGALVDERGNVIGVVVAKLSQRAALATSGALAENVNYAVKSSYLLSFLESVPEVAAKLKDAHTKERKFEDVVKSVEQATVLVLVY